MKNIGFILILLLATQTSWAKYNVCSITINSNDELTIFKSKLNPNEFTFTELTKYGDANNKSQWFAKACEAGVKCDVLLISGHFGGSFFGKDSDISLSLKELTTASCKNTCDGIVKDLKEVYLFGCNTLAGKTKDHRTPEEYLRVLVDDGINGAEAQRIVSTRYGPFGPSFSDQMSRVFENAPIIYGFDGVAPTGARIAPSLRKFLNDLGGYKQHLESNKTSSSAKIWSDAMSAYNRTSIAGLKKQDAGYGIKAKMCHLQDDKLSVAIRFRNSLDMLSQNILLYLPTVARFISENVKAEFKENSAEVQKELLALKNNTAVVNKVNSLLGTQGVILSDKIDFLEMKKRIGWITPQVFDGTLQKIFRERLLVPSRANTDTVCSLLDDKAEYRKYVDVAVVKGYDFSKKEHFSILNCSEIHEKDAALTLKATRSFAKNWPRFKKESAEALWISAYAVASGSGQDEQRFQLLSTALVNPPNYMGESAALMKQIVLAPVAPSTLLQTWINSAKTLKDEDKARLNIELAAQSNRISSVNLISIIDVAVARQFSIWETARFLKGDLLVERKLAQNWFELDETTQYSLRTRIAFAPDAVVKSEGLSSVITDSFITAVKNGSGYQGLVAEAVVKLKVNPKKLAEIYTLYQKSSQSAHPTLRHVLFRHNGHVIFKDKTIQTGEKQGYRFKGDIENEHSMDSYTYI